MAKIVTLNAAALSYLDDCLCFLDTGNLSRFPLRLSQEEWDASFNPLVGQIQTYTHDCFTMRYYLSAEGRAVYQIVSYRGYKGVAYGMYGQEGKAKKKTLDFLLSNNAIELLP